jgi:NAD(P)-dependent dehydrogenase (short-subunit alcohol dehydrogenase family)
MEIQNKTFLISGGGSGLGEATVKMLAENGAQVVIADLNRETGENLAAEFAGRVRFVQTDVSDEADVQVAVDTAIKVFGGLQGAINCAGIGVVGKVLDKEGIPHPLDSFTRGIQINLIGTFNVIRLAAKIMTQARPNPEGERGVIVNTASVAAFDGQIGQVCYAASKAGVVGMTLPIARELARFGIRVVTVAPGLFDTPMMASLPEAARESLGKQVPFPARLGRPIEYAALVRHIIENVMLNGETIRLDGAIRMPPK